MQNYIFDAHQDILMGGFDKNGNKQTKITELNNSGIKLVFASIFIEDTQELSNNEIIKKIKSDIDSYLKLIENNQELILIKNNIDIFSLLKSKKTGVVLHVEGLDFLKKDNIQILDSFYNKGLRSVGLVWGEKNEIMSSWKQKGGLSDFGKKIVKYLNDKKIIIDLSHSNEQSFLEVIKTSSTPVMATHANSYELCPIKRNIKKNQSRALIKNGGVQGVFFSKKFVSKKEECSIDDVIKHIEKISNIDDNLLVIGSDFGGITSNTIKDIGNIKDYENFKKKMLGIFPIEKVKKIQYENLQNYLLKVI